MSRRDKKEELSRAIESGQLWRAKEILSGRVGTLRFDAEMYEHFGALLLRMGDDVQAGRFLFLSGKRRPEHQAAIDLFLRKHVRGGRGEMFAAFPAQVRRRQWVDLPAQVQQELEALKFGPSEGGAIWAKPRFPKEPSSSAVGCLLALVAIAGLAFLLSLFIVHFFY